MSAYDGLWIDTNLRVQLYIASFFPVLSSILDLFTFFTFEPWARADIGIIVMYMTQNILADPVVVVVVGGAMGVIIAPL